MYIYPLFSAACWLVVAEIGRTSTFEGSFPCPSYRPPVAKSKSSNNCQYQKPAEAAI